MKWIILCVIATLCPYVGHLCLKKTRGFALYKIHSSFVSNPLWEINPISASERSFVKGVLNQPYRFLDKGAQSYVFLSEDGQYVIKFFKLHSLQPPWLLRVLRLPYHLQPLWVKKCVEKRMALMKTFASYKIAYEDLREQTGMLFLHLNKTRDLKQKIRIIDALGISHLLDLDSMEFLVQKRADLFYPQLKKLIEEKGIESGKEILSDLVDFLVKRNQKEIFDKDPDLATNFGFLDNRIVQIDVGRFRKDPERKNPSLYRDEILRITDQFNAWLKTHYPCLSEHLEREIASLATHKAV
jgi:hypothetical protein